MKTIITQVLELVEKHEKNEMSFFGSRFKNVSELKKYDSETNKRVNMLKNPRDHPFLKRLSHALPMLDRREGWKTTSRSSRFPKQSV